MRAILPRGGRATGLLVSMIVLGAPALASAQLFPNLPIRRERTPCANENPQYKMIRQEYWGYYPTCWRRFPPGWGCPSAEAPNWERAKTELQLDPLGPSEGGPDGQPNRDGARRGAANGEAPDPNRPGPGAPDTMPEDKIPLPKEGPSPFDSIPGAAPVPGGDPAFPGDTPAPPAGPDAPIDAPRAPNLSPPSGAATPPLGAAPAPRRGRSMLAGLFGGRRR